MKESGLQLRSSDASLSSLHQVLTSIEYIVAKETVLLIFSLWRTNFLCVDGLNNPELQAKDSAFERKVHKEEGS